MKEVNVVVYKKLRHISARNQMIELIGKRPVEKIKYNIDFYNFFNEDDRVILSIADVYVYFSSGIVVDEIKHYDDRFVSINVSGGANNTEYNINVVVIMSDGQVWECAMKLLVSNSISTAIQQLPII